MNKNIKKFLTAVVSLTVIIATVSFSAVGGSESILEEVKVQEVIKDILQNDNSVPLDVTREEMQLVIDKGGEDGMQAIKTLVEKAIPVDSAVSDDEGSNDATSAQMDSAGFSYRCAAESTQVEYVDGAEFVSTGFSLDPLITIGDAVVEQLNAPQTRAFPDEWEEIGPQNYDDTRSTCKLLIVTNNGNYVGSGFLISNSNVGTAGHCVYDAAYGDASWAKYITVIPSYSNGNRPYGAATSTFLEAGGNWINNRAMSDDWGIITLDRSFSIGFMGLMAPGNDIITWGVRVQGYPGDSPYLYLLDDSVASASNRILLTNKTTRGGMSGGPCLEDRGYIIGFVKGHYTSGPNTGKSIIVKFDSWLFNKMASYR